MRRGLLLLAGLLILAGCQSTPTEKQVASIAATCSSFGFKPGTDYFAMCMHAENNRRIDRADAYRQSVGAGLQQAGANMQRNSQLMQPTMITCSKGYGSTVNCY